MRRRRQPRAIWQQTRQRIWQRDKGRCQGPYCYGKPAQSLLLYKAHIDHVLELSHRGTNADSNLRTLCRRCHVLRARKSHQGMISKALHDGIIPPNWRSLVWE
ncbi:MAG: HNH endonuclease [Drouetiella hepatica Uher 2000/2452]|uniref:HNH endonuclease n=1 Tax=Drouetiella hepatica Uher 2000/2452 TaxID=904376 RepID=A0A951QF55_9CYAN|nr:HNH endonuclease [Drouetiella hepatica Uher 2000/2452]